MASSPPSPAPPAAASTRISAKDLITLGCSVIAAGFVIAGAIRSDGQREQRLEIVETKIGKLEASDDRRRDLLTQIDIRTARIEVKLEMMTKGPGQ